MAEVLASIATGVVELLYWLRGVFAGWRYLFSRAYRDRTHARWRNRSWVYAAVEVVSAAVACAVLLIVVYFLFRFAVARA
jgi:hypothetical protein